MITLPDAHPAWRLVGAWIAARQRGDVHALAAGGHLVDDARRAQLDADLAALAALAGGPLATGAELSVEAHARRVDADVIEGLQVRLVGTTASGPVVSALALARLERDPASDPAAPRWRIAALLTDDERRTLADPAFVDAWTKSRR